MALGQVATQPRQHSRRCLPPQAPAGARVARAQVAAVDHRLLTARAPHAPAHEARRTALALLEHDEPAEHAARQILGRHRAATALGPTRLERSCPRDVHRPAVTAAAPQRLASVAPDELLRHEAPEALAAEVLDALAVVCTLIHGATSCEGSTGHVERSAPPPPASCRSHARSFRRNVVRAIPSSRAASDTHPPQTRRMRSTCARSAEASETSTWTYARSGGKPEGSGAMSGGRTAATSPSTAATMRGGRRFTTFTRRVPGAGCSMRRAPTSRSDFAPTVTAPTRASAPARARRCWPRARAAR
jgi:hypothetical protein